MNMNVQQFNNTAELRFVVASDELRDNVNDIGMRHNRELQRKLPKVIVLT